MRRYYLDRLLSDADCAGCGAALGRGLVATPVDTSNYSGPVDSVELVGPPVCLRCAGESIDAWDDVAPTEPRPVGSAA